MNALALPRSSRRLILAGGGHTHALVLRRWAMHGTPKGASVTLVNRTGGALYSGTVPALIGGLIDRQACRIDLRQLAEAAGVMLICAEIIGLNLEQRQLLLQDRPPLPWDLLSLDMGAVTAPATSAAGTPITSLDSSPAIKPLEPFLRWWEALQGLDDPISVVGSGAAGLEVALAMAGRRRRQGRAHRIRLVSRSAPLPEPFQTALREAGIAVLEQPEPNSRILRCTGSRAPDWLAAAGLPCDPSSGRLLTTATLQVLGHPTILAAGDCAVIGTSPRPPSGVWAVRAALPLARNLERHLQDHPLQSWRPPRRALQLLGDGGAVTGHPRAMARWGPLRTPFHPLLWHLKARIDRRFLERFASLGSMPTAGHPSGPSPTGMACNGCAAKLAAAPLAEALRSLQQAAPSPIPRGTEDAHPLLVDADGRTWWQSVDGFPALVSDPWLNGRLTALHACSDLWACGAQVHSALAVVSLPRQAEAWQADLLSQILAGIRSVLQPLGADLLGGHTLQAVGPDAAAARPVVQLTVNGNSPPGQAWPKGGLEPGDALILTRGLGSGVLFAATQAGAAEPEWIDAALAQMQQSQAPVVDLLAQHGCHGCTDITGFGLLGHLGEMVAAAQQRCRSGALMVELDAGALPAFAGALPCLAQGLASSLAPANQRSLALLEEQGPVRLLGPASPEQRALLVDPQTCGPLLAAVPAAAAGALLENLHRAGFAQACRIGSVHRLPH